MSFFKPKFNVGELVVYSSISSGCPELMKITATARRWGFSAWHLLPYRGYSGVTTQLYHDDGGKLTPFTNGRGEIAKSFAENVAESELRPAPSHLMHILEN
jgi:hypothetical protein